LVTISDSSLRNIGNWNKRSLQYSGLPPAVYDAVTLDAVADGGA